MRVWLSFLLTVALVTLTTSCSGSSTKLSPTTSDTSDNGSPTSDYQLPITAIEDLHVTGQAPKVDIENYHLSIDGLVESPLSLGYSDVTDFPVVSKIVVLNCPGFFVDNAEWTGVPVSILLNIAGVKPEASQAAFFSIDGYQRVLTIKEVLQNGAFLAYKVNGQVLPLEHGYPFRLVLKGQDGANWIKWVNRIEVK